MAGIQTTLKAEAIRAALNGITGTEPKILYAENSARIYWTPEDQKRVQNWLETVSRPSGKHQDVSIDFAPVILPLALKKAFIPILALLAAGYIAGKMI
jgi:hypothetical protein